MLRSEWVNEMPTSLSAVKLNTTIATEELANAWRETIHNEERKLWYVFRCYGTLCWWILAVGCFSPAWHSVFKMSGHWLLWIYCVIYTYRRVLAASVSVHTVEDNCVLSFVIPRDKMKSSCGHEDKVWLRLVSLLLPTWLIPCCVTVVVDCRPRVWSWSGQILWPALHSLLLTMFRESQTHDKVAIRKFDCV